MFLQVWHTRFYPSNLWNTFILVFRAYEQIKFNIDSMKLKILFVGVGSGHGFSWDGPTHFGVNDIALLNTLSNFIISNQ